MPSKDVIKWGTCAMIYVNERYSETDYSKRVFPKDNYVRIRIPCQDFHED